MRYNNTKLAALALGASVAVLLLGSVSMADGDEGSKSRKTTTAAAPVAVLSAAPAYAAPAAPAAISQPPVIYNFYFGSPTASGVSAPAGAAPVGSYTTAPAPVVSSAPAAPGRTQYDIYCASCHGNSYKNSSVSKIQAGNSESSSMRAAVGSLSTSILSAIAAGQ